MKEKVILVLLILGIFWGIPLAYGQTEAAPNTPEKITVEGRLSFEKHGEQDWLVLSGKDAQTYLISGKLKDQLQNSLLELGQNNLVAVTGIKNGGYKLNCKHTRRYDYQNGEKVLVTEAVCKRYYYLEVAEILSAKQSNEKMPPPKRESTQEKSILKRDRENVLLPPEYLLAKIKSLNMKSPVKSMVVIPRDKNSTVKSVTILITANTRILKNMGENQDPVPFDAGALKVGQEINVAYTNKDLKKEAMAIMIVK